MSAITNYIASLGCGDFGYEESLDRRCRTCHDEGYTETDEYCPRCPAGRAAYEQDELDRQDVRREGVSPWN